MYKTLLICYLEDKQHNYVVTISHLTVRIFLKTKQQLMYIHNIYKVGHNLFPVNPVYSLLSVS
jgi:hypothetical protein